MRSKIFEAGRMAKFARKDLMTGQNPWNGASENADPTGSPRQVTPKSTTREKLVIQSPTSGSTTDDLEQWRTRV